MSEIFGNIGIGLVCFLVFALLYFCADKAHTKYNRPIGKIVLAIIAGIIMFASCGSFIKESLPQYFDKPAATESGEIVQ